MSKEKKKPSVGARLDRFAAGKLKKLKEKRGEKDKLFLSVAATTVLTFWVSKQVKRVVWTETDSKFKNILVATIKSAVLYKVATVLGSDMQIDLIPEIPDVSKLPEEAKEQKEFAEMLWERRSEVWDIISETIDQLSFPEVMDFIKERGRLRTFVETAAMTQWASSMGSTGKWLKKGSITYKKWFEQLKAEVEAEKNKKE